jgi:uncharacterized membrane protein
VRWREPPTRTTLTAVGSAASRDDERGELTRTLELTSGFDAGRVFALSDGVFAIASTLLALDLRVPAGLGQDELISTLVDLSPTLRGYVISYLVIGLLWLGHHAVFRIFVRITRPVAALNILLLGMVALLPFPSSLLSRYDSEPITVVLYAADVSAVLIIQLLMLTVGWHRGLLTPRLRPAAVFLPSSITAAVFVVSIPVALLSTDVAIYGWLLLVPAHFLLTHTVRKHPTGRRG